MNTEALYALIASAFAKFLAAGLSVDQARFGLFGTWVVNDGDRPIPRSESNLDRALASRDAWETRFGKAANPYSDLVRFHASGASLGRWENRILDLYGPGGERLGGVPLSSLVASADHGR